VMAQMGAGQIIGVDLSTDHGRVFDIERVPGTLALLRDKLRPRSKQRYRLPTVPETLLDSSFISSISKQKAMRKFADILFQPRISRVGMLEWKRYNDIVAAGYNHAKDILGEMTGDQLSKFR
jgi:NTE family protein